MDDIRTCGYYIYSNEQRKWFLAVFMEKDIDISIVLINC